MSTSLAAGNSYDELPYPSQPLPQSDPDRMASLAMLLGVRSPATDRCRVLELGCSTGGNLLPLADRQPGSQYVGVDYSQRQIATARQSAAEIGLANVEFLDRSILDLDASLGTFDYIICHGVYSWVSRDIQDKILQFCRDQLSPTGVAYISYNTYPGWHRREILREIACTSAPANHSPQRRADEAAHVLRSLRDALVSDETPYGRGLREEMEVLLRQPTTYLFHEYLETENHPEYFFEFADRIAAHGLQYLGEGMPSMMFATNFGAEISQRLLEISNDLVAIEQHMDFLRNRAFRQSMICRAEVPLVRYIAPRQLAGLYVSARLRPNNAEPNLGPDVVESFTAEASSMVAAGSGAISSPSPAFKAAMLLLGRIWPRSIAYETLLDEVTALLGNQLGQTLAEIDRENLGHNIVQCISTGVLDVVSQPDRFVTALSAHPQVSRLARWQAKATPGVTNRRHEHVPLDQLGQQLLLMLDGQHDRDAMLQSLVGNVDRGEMSILLNGIPATRGEEVRPLLEESLDGGLARLAGQALLVS